MEDHDLTWSVVGARCICGDQRLYGARDSLSAEKDHSNRLVHHYDRSSAGGSGPRAQPAQSHDLRLEKLSLLLPAHARPPHFVWRTRGILSGERPDGAAKRGNPAAGNDRGVPATAGCEGRV